MATSYIIDYNYLSGLSITHGAPGSRNHIWSYSAGWREDIPHMFNCPCAAHPSTEPLTPDYVGDHFYCDTATYNSPQWNGTPTTHCGMERTAIQVVSAAPMIACHGSGGHCLRRPQTMWSFVGARMVQEMTEFQQSYWRYPYVNCNEGKFNVNKPHNMHSNVGSIIPICCIVLLPLRGSKIDHLSWRHKCTYFNACLLQVSPQ